MLSVLFGEDSDLLAFVALNSFRFDPTAVKRNGVVAAAARVRDCGPALHCMIAAGPLASSIHVDDRAPGSTATMSGTLSSIMLTE